MKKKRQEMIETLLFAFLALAVAAVVALGIDAIRELQKEKTVEPETVTFVTPEMKQKTYDEVFGVDPETDFVPGYQDISPEDELYNNMELIAKVVEAEAANQQKVGKTLVANVILNRLKSEDFPDTVVKVIYQEGAFSVIGNGRAHNIAPTEETWKIVEAEVEKYLAGEELMFDSLYFCSTGWPKYGEKDIQIGDHFATK